MLRASLLAAASSALMVLSVVVACNDVETRGAPDAGNRVCDPGPFVFNADGEKAVAISTKPAEAACSADGTNLDVINRLPRGGWYPTGWKAQTVGTTDTSGQGECEVITVCTCTPGDTTTNDAGQTTSGEPRWVCG